MAKATAKSGVKGKRGRGQPTKLTPELKAAIFFLARRGCTDEQIAQVLGIAHRSIDNWKINLDFLQTLNTEKATADDLVERSLYERALGYEFETEEVMHYKGADSEVVNVVKKLPPDVTACIFWLKNRRRDLWRDKSEMEHSGVLSLEELVSGSMPSRTGTLHSPSLNGNP